MKSVVPSPISRQFTLLAVLGACWLPITTQASSLAVEVSDSAGKPVPDVIVYAEPLASSTPFPRTKTVEIEQKDKRFIPLVTVIQAGTEVQFPNNDTVRHHVYSFSPAKNFELKLYAGIPAKPVLFDKPGTVVIGCNIHDQMVGYIHVVGTPYFAKTDATGKVRLDGLTNGRYRLKAWHYDLPTGTAVPEQGVSVSGNDTAPAFVLTLKSGKAGG